MKQLVCHGTAPGPAPELPPLQEAPLCSRALGAPRRWPWPASHPGLCGSPYWASLVVLVPLCAEWHQVPGLYRSHRVPAAVPQAEWLELGLLGSFRTPAAIPSLWKTAAPPHCGCDAKGAVLCCMSQQLHELALPWPGCNPTKLTIQPAGHNGDWRVPILCHLLEERNRNPRPSWLSLADKWSGTQLSLSRWWLRLGQQQKQSFPGETFMGH